MPVSFEPVYNSDSKILILGSFPSVKSREVSFYYGHPQNRFWNVLEAITDSKLPDLKNRTIEEKKEFLLTSKIALWDVVHSCDITGSSDSSIKNVVPNDIASLLKKADIKAIYCNGSTSKKLYDKFVFPITHMRAVKLPSTSPANAGMKPNELIGIWSRINIVLKRSDFEQRIYSLNSFANDRYGHKLYKLSLDGGFTCPNRDGTLGSNGCIFCDGEGSGHFAGNMNKLGVRECAPIPEQLQFQKELIASKTANKKVGYIAYFQSFTGTYAPIETLKEKYYEAIADPEVEIISIATRPDCISDEIIDLLKKINDIKPVWIELGLQTIHRVTADFIRRGYELKVYDAAVRKLLGAGLNHIITHVILGLPGESVGQMLQTVEYVCSNGAQGIKLQLLHVLKGTDLCELYEKQSFDTLTMEEYIGILDKCMEVIPPDMVVHRLSGDGNKKTLVAPLWSGDKKRVLNEIKKISKNLSD